MICKSTYNHYNLKWTLRARGWEVPVLEGYTAAIELAKLMVNLGLNASGITYMGARPQRLPPKVLI